MKKTAGKRRRKPDKWRLELPKPWTRSDRTVDPVLQLAFLRQRADALGNLFAALEDHDRRHRLDLVLLRHRRVVIDVELSHLDLALHVGRHLLKGRRHG